MRCKEFYEKWERCGNFCEKHPKTAEQIDEYLSFIEQLNEEQRRAFSPIPATVLKPLINEQDEETKQKAISYVENLANRKTPTGGAYKKEITGVDIVKALSKVRQEVKGETILPALPKGKYRTVIIDPPWEIEKIQRMVRPNQIEMDYLSMTIKEIEEYQPILNSFDKIGCHVYLWTTHKHLPDALKLFDSWDVNYQCVLTWIKNVGITPFTWMYSTELILFGRIGNLHLLKNGLRIDFNGKVREHSRKPDEFYDLVKQASPEPRIDIFSREKRDGFEQYGDEVNRFQK